VAESNGWHGDVIVVGAGPAGCATAATLARLGATVAIVDDGRRPAWPGETLPGGSTAVINDVFGDGILDPHQQAYGVQSAWETEDLQMTDGLANPLGEGWLLDRRIFDTDAREAAIRQGAYHLIGHARVHRDADSCWRVEVAGHRLRAPVIIDATGRSAAIARRAGAGLERAERLLACIVTVDDPGDPVQATTVESVADGWWYSTPTPSGGRVLALVSDQAIVPRGIGRSEWWLTSLEHTRHIRGLISTPITIDTAAAHLRVSRAGTGWLDHACGSGWVAVGDAAAHFDPLSSQGLLTGILMGARAAIAIAENTLEEWSLDYRMIVDEHRELANHYYGSVERWQTSSFWSTRASRVLGVR